MPNDPVSDLLALASTQRGCFTWPQAKHVGWTEHFGVIAKKTEWKRLGRGVFVHLFVWEQFTPREQHLCLAMARVLGGRSSWHAARRTAALVHDLPLLGTDPTTPQLIRHTTAKGANAASRHERIADLPEQDRQVVRGLPSSTPPRTAVDIARDESFMSAVVVADGVLRAGTSDSELKQCAKRCALWRGGLNGLRMAEFADGLSESVLESISRVRMHLRALPKPELQIKVYLGDELIARLDFLWRQYNAVGLADGAIKYDSREDVMAEKWQVERLQDIGLEVARWGWDSAYKEKGDLEYKVRRVLDRGSRQVIDPRVRFVTTTIAENALANQRAAARRAG